MSDKTYDPADSALLVVDPYNDFILVKDATAAFSREAMQAAVEVNWPTFAHAILTTPQVLAAIG